MLREYFLGILALSLTLAFGIGVSHSRLKGAVTVSAGILMISAILLPLVDIFGKLNINDVTDGLFDDIEYEELTDDTVERAFEMGIAQYITDKYGVPPDSVLVMADGFKLESLRAERIYVTLSGKAALLDYKKIEKEIEESFTLGGECEVSLRIE